MKCNRLPGRPNTTDSIWGRVRRRTARPLSLSARRSRPCPHRADANTHGPCCLPSPRCSFSVPFLADPITVPYARVSSPEHLRAAAAVPPPFFPCAMGVEGRARDAIASSLALGVSDHQPCHLELLSRVFARLTAGRSLGDISQGVCRTRGVRRNELNWARASWLSSKADSGRLGEYARLWPPTKSGGGTVSQGHLKVTGQTHLTAYDVDKNLYHGVGKCLAQL